MKDLGEAILEQLQLQICLTPASLTTGISKKIYIYISQETAGNLGKLHAT